MELCDPEPEHILASVLGEKDCFARPRAPRRLPSRIPSGSGLRMSADALEAGKRLLLSALTTEAVGRGILVVDVGWVSPNDGAGAEILAWRVGRRSYQVAFTVREVTDAGTLQELTPEVGFKLWREIRKAHSF